MLLFGDHFLLPFEILANCWNAWLLNGFCGILMDFTFGSVVVSVKVAVLVQKERE